MRNAGIRPMADATRLYGHNPCAGTYGIGVCDKCLRRFGVSATHLAPAPLGLQCITCVRERSLNDHRRE